MKNANPGNATRLLYAVVIKAGLEFLLIMSAVSLAAYSHINPPIRGAIDIADTGTVAGWAYDPREPGAKLEVQVFIDDRLVTTATAGDLRPDLVSAGAAETPDHGFRVDLAGIHLAPGRHQVAVYALRRGGGKDRMLLALNMKDVWLDVR